MLLKINGLRINGLNMLIHFELGLLTHFYRLKPELQIWSSLFRV